MRESRDYLYRLERGKETTGADQRLWFDHLEYIMNPPELVRRNGDLSMQQPLTCTQKQQPNKVQLIKYSACMDWKPKRTSPVVFRSERDLDGREECHQTAVTTTCS